MDPNIKSSFIPDSMLSQQSGGSSGGGVADILVLIAVVIFAAILALAAGVFLYDRFLDASVAKKSEQLERARQSFDPRFLKEVVRLDARLDAADAILANHYAPTELFKILEMITLKSVAYESMDYKLNDDGSIKLDLQGNAQSVNGVALQASVFGQHNAITNPIFADIDLVNNGVSFNVSATVNPASVLYAATFNQRDQGSGASGVPSGASAEFENESGGEFTNTESSSESTDAGSVDDANTTTDGAGSETGGAVDAGNPDDFGGFGGS